MARTLQSNAHTNNAMYAFHANTAEFAKGIADRQVTRIRAARARTAKDWWPFRREARGAEILWEKRKLEAGQLLGR
jgi:hypothetical protein